jgi:hypothetical protein
MEKLISLIRSTQNASDEQLTEALRTLSPVAREELLVALAAIPRASEGFECSVCKKIFPRKWNRDRHVAAKHAKASSFCCPFVECSNIATFGTAFALVEHLSSSHSLETKPGKRPRTGVRHDDHYDFLLPSGALLHVGEAGLEEHALQPRSQPRSAETEMPAHDHSSIEGHPVKHGDHMDMLVGDKLHCMDGLQPSCTFLDIVDMDDGGDWDELLKSLDFACE